MALSEKDWKEITDFVATHPHLELNGNKDSAWVVLLDRNGDVRGGIHPRSLLDMIHEDKTNL